ncbi:hypothetical protein O181_070536 [Austropuccinia psidii MF-1]|uniref:Uncharacterized protein n=1 Tax=Austropuccinia psidii MF-1 TaxID=1389203 RepID=A0A9Q3EYY4_9BASI|nr:hypothetical protein [Austropuccinia psidii MF-1]
MRHQQVRPPPVGTSTFEQEYPLPPCYSDFHKAYDHHDVRASNNLNHEFGAPSSGYSSNIAYSSSSPIRLEQNLFGSINHIVQNFANPDNQITLVTDDPQLEVLIAPMTLNPILNSNWCKKELQKFTDGFYLALLSHFSNYGVIKFPPDEGYFARIWKTIEDIFTSVLSLNSYLEIIVGHDASKEVCRQNSQKLMQFCGNVLFNKISFAAAPRTLENENIAGLSDFEKSIWSCFSNLKDRKTFLMEWAQGRYQNITGKQQKVTQLAISLLTCYYIKTNEKKFHTLFATPDALPHFLARLAVCVNINSFEVFLKEFLKDKKVHGLLPWEQAISDSEELKNELRRKFHPAGERMDVKIILA